jgi:hypothetical protein
MGDNVIFFRPVEKVGTVVDVLKSCGFSTFPIVDTEEANVLFGTISRNILCALLKKRAFGRPAETSSSRGAQSNYIHSNGEVFIPIAEWETVEESYTKYPSVHDFRLGVAERDCLLDLRPYANTAPISIQETASVNVSAWPCLCGRWLWLFRVIFLTRRISLSSTPSPSLFYREHIRCFVAWDCDFCQLLTNAIRLLVR